jgi:multiple sugar transport system substrate-binding protein
MAASERPQFALSATSALVVRSHRHLGSFGVERLSEGARQGSDKNRTKRPSATRRRKRAPARSSRHVALLLACGTLVGAAAVGCGDAEEGGGGGGTQTETGSTNGAKVIDVNGMKTAAGDVTVCMGKDAAGDITEAVKQFNAQGNGITVKLLELASSADEERARFVQLQEAKSDECDVLSLDVIWAAEFALQKWLYDLTPYVEQRTSELIPVTVETATFDGKVWGVPQQTDAAFLYYRTDQVQHEPATWQEVYAIAKQKKGIVYQAASYEGLTCNFLELAFAAGGRVLSDDSSKSAINSPENLKALQVMADGVKNGIAARSVTTYMEEESRRYFESGRATFMRNWPYAYALGQTKGTNVAGKFDVMPFPEFAGAGKASVLGGHNQVISVYSKNPGGALKWIDYVTGEENQKRQFVEYSQASTLAALYDDPDVKKKYAFAALLKQAISQAKPRPVSPVYSQISQAIYTNVNEALAGRTSAQEALEKAQEQIDQALARF